MKNFIRTTLAAGLFLGMAPIAGAQEFKAPTGTLGAGLDASKQGSARFYGEAGIGHGKYNLGPQIGDLELTGAPTVFGFGYKPLKYLEIEARLPLAIGAVSVFGESNGTVIPGNLYLAGNVTTAGKKYRLTVGGAFAFGPWTRDADPYVTGALLSSIMVRHHDPELYMPESVNIVVPARFEFDAFRSLLLSADVKFSGHFLTESAANDYAILQMSPGAAYVSDTIEVGGRVPLYYRMTDNAGTFDTTISGDDKAQLSVEPYFRYKIGRSYLNARFTFNVDNPNGVSFSEDSVFAFYFGGGMSL